MTVSSSVQYQLTCSRLTEEANPSWQIGSHPLVASSDDEVGDLGAFIQRHKAESLSGIDETESQFASLADAVHDVANGKADAQMVDGWQEEPITLQVDECRRKMTSNIVRRPASVEDLVTHRNSGDLIAGASYFVFNGRKRPRNPWPLGPAEAGHGGSPQASSGVGARA
jgi:hypothetical protein